MIKINIIPRLKYYFTLCAFISFASTADSIRIASGSSNGVYYPVALKICELINNNNSIVACEVIETSGSVTNLELLKTGKADFAVIQSDAALDSFQGKGIFFGDKPFEDMRFVLSLFDEYLTLITKNESGIVLFGDLNGKKIGANLNGTG
ncbi:MAG: TAXI family TRAP transporter solute-binding subunit, partial [Rickettsiaceae bacterium]|nr:TAXI family TRAP transporter solute-binding subunit [Rickettsiaceae bacterium]